MSEYLLSSNTALSPSPVETPGNKYAELKKRVKDQGLLDKRTGHYAVRISLTCGAMLAGIAFLFLVDNFWLQMLNALYLALVFAQVAYIAHDAGHRQIFPQGWKNELTSLFCSGILGMGKTWWIEKHNQHHSHPNHDDLDPDLDIPLIFFSEENVNYPSRNAFERFIIRYQSFLFFLLICFVALDMKKTTLIHIIQEYKNLKQPVLEWCAFILHIGLSIGILLFALGPWQALAFIAINQAMLGFILGSAFAPNHKGMPTFQRDSNIDFLHRQILTSRNIRGGAFNDFWYGGLNYQIEHHLFPTMPRINLKYAQSFVKDFCHKNQIEYTETSIMGGYRAIIGQLNQVSAAQKVFLSHHK